MGCIVLGWLTVRGVGAYFECCAVGTGERKGVKWVALSMLCTLLGADFTQVTTFEIGFHAMKWQSCGDEYMT